MLMKLGIVRSQLMVTEIKLMFWGMKDQEYTLPKEINKHPTKMKTFMINPLPNKTRDKLDLI